MRIPKCELPRSIQLRWSTAKSRAFSVTTARRSAVATDWDRVERILAAARPIAEARGASLAQIALAWLLTKEHVTSVVVGARRLDQLEGNLKCTRVELTAEGARIARTQTVLTDVAYGRGRVFRLLTPLRGLGLLEELFIRTNPVIDLGSMVRVVSESDPHLGLWQAEHLSRVGSIPVVRM